jgi:pyruvate dehydrogenase E2 component (dihydrolipoamide acetyltransferase)
MAEVIRMPKMSDTMTEGVIVSWLKQVGDDIKPGDILAEVETDKATMELENYVKGTLLHIGIPAGGSVPVDALIAIVGQKGHKLCEKNLCRYRHTSFSTSLTKPSSCLAM